MKIKALRRKDTKEFVQIVDDSGKALVFTSELPNPQPETADWESTVKYFDKYSDQIDINDFELVELTVTEQYDSLADTLKHQKRIMQLVNMATAELLKKVALHDNSKLYEPEKSIFDEWTPKLASSSIGTEEYENMKKQMKIALDHHYANNTHHPEHFENGLNDMDLLEIFELFFDWKAASERHLDGNIYKSITVNKERFKMSDQLEQIFIKTAKRMNF